MRIQWWSFEFEINILAYLCSISIRHRIMLSEFVWDTNEILFIKYRPWLGMPQKLWREEWTSHVAEEFHVAKYSFRAVMQMMWNSHFIPTTEYSNIFIASGTIKTIFIELHRQPSAITHHADAGDNDF